MLLANVFDYEVVYNQTERDGTPFVGEESWCVMGCMVSMCSQVFDEAIVGEYAGLWKSVHSFAYFNEEVSVVDETC